MPRLRAWNASGALLAVFLLACSQFEHAVARRVAPAAGFESLLPIPSANMCGWLDGLGTFKCGIVGVFESTLSGIPLTCKNTSATGFYLQQEPLSVSLTGKPIPEPLTDLMPLPSSIDAATVNKEGATYYWYYRVLRNLEAYSICSPPNGGNASMLIPNGWKLPKVANLAQGFTGAPKSLPFAAVMLNKRTKQLVVLFRGTQTGFEWSVDFMYNQTSDLYPGLPTHSGMSYVSQSFNSLVKLVTRQVAEGCVKHIAVTGHSLGAGVSTLFAYGLQLAVNKMTGGKRHSSIRVDTVLFAPPNAGSPAFVASFNNLVNARRIAFENDIVPQVPCTPNMVACPGTLVPTNQPGNVTSWPFSAVTNASMPVQQVPWGAMTSVSLKHTVAFLSASHICSYSCFTSQFVGDKNNYCLLLDDLSLVGSNSYCGGFPTNTPYP